MRLGAAVRVASWAGSTPASVLASVLPLEATTCELSDRQRCLAGTVAYRLDQVG